MDRLYAIKIFVATLDEGSLAGAGRRVGKSPAAVSRAIAYLEQRLGVELLHRSTRALRLSEAGERFAVACRRIIADLEEAETLAAGERSEPRGTLTVTAPVAAGEDVVRSVVDEYVRRFPTVSVRLHLLDRLVNLIDEGVDVALRIAPLPDSNLVSVKVGEVTRVLAAAPDYLERSGRPRDVTDLGGHSIVSMTHFGIDSWTFASSKGAAASRVIQFQPSVIVNSVRSAVDYARSGHGVTRLFSYHVAREFAAGSLVRLLPGAEGPVLPVSLVAPNGRFQVPKVRAFVDLAAPSLRAFFRRSAEACAAEPVAGNGVGACDEQVAIPCG